MIVRIFALTFFLTVMAQKPHECSSGRVSLLHSCYTFPQHAANCPSPLNKCAYLSPSPTLLPSSHFLLWRELCVFFSFIGWFWFCFLLYICHKVNVPILLNDHCQFIIGIHPQYAQFREQFIVTEMLLAAVSMCSKWNSYISKSSLRQGSRGWEDQCHWIKPKHERKEEVRWRDKTEKIVTMLTAREG